MRTAPALATTAILILATAVAARSAAAQSAAPPSPAPHPPASQPSSLGTLPMGRLVYTSDRARDGGLNVWMLEAGSDEPRQLTFGDVNDFTARISPDGSRIAFASDRDNPQGLSAGGSFLRVYDLYSLDLASSEVTELHRSRTFKMRPTWSPDGSLIAFDGEDPGAEQMEQTGGLVPQIWLMPADGSQAPVALTDEPGGAISPTWSPDGTRLAYATVADGRIMVMDLEARRAAALTDGPGDSAPSWSPDGTRIAFSSDRSGDMEIYTLGADGSDLVRLTDSPGFDAQVTWSPDGSMLAFTSDRGGDGRDILIMAADGSGQVAVSGNPAGDDGEHRGSDFSPSWSD